MKKLVLLLFFCSSVWAKINVIDGKIQPFNNKRYTLKELIKDYAELMNLNTTYPSNLFSDKDSVHVQLNTATSKEDYKNLFFSLLDMQGYTTMEQKGILWVYNSRDIRYLSSPIYTDNTYPTNSTYSTVLIKLKYPLASEAARNCRPIMSRYGRVIDLSDGKTLIINDLGGNIKRLTQSISKMDTEEAFKNKLNFQPKSDEDENSIEKEKIVELSLENKILEKKLIELKGTER